MKNIAKQNIASTVILTFIALTFTLWADHSTAADTKRTGVGVGLGSKVNSIYYPMRFGKLMVEPMYYYYNNETTYQGMNDFSEQNTGVAFGVGVFTLDSIIDDSKVEGYWGLRIGYATVYASRKSANESIQDDEFGILFEPTVGAQYFLSPRFSISTDASFVVYTGSVDLISNGQIDSYSDHDFSGTQARVIFRGYLK